MFTVYILFSTEIDKHYVGYTQKSADERLNEHLYNHKGFTGKAKDWKIVYLKEMTTKPKALLLERKIKKRGAKRYLNDISSR
ncbi:GIY-YIG nuclease family protein [uncultured Polaribacter sp.]|uniref:GIY-YIG nuclease family protein n=1 Tax=uncultured Polaribacter sp. TaxID=174711 RepID=UPI002604A56A|nr:GIY-YIG nuclease family protein [uncultured Polaribacter sp.]